MSKQTLVSQLLNMRKKQKWLEVETQETSATIAAIMLQLFKCSEFDVQADSLDVELVPVDGSSSIDLEKGTAIFQEDEHQEQLSRNESEKTLSGGDGVVEYDAVVLATSTDLHGEEDISEDVPKPAQFLYSMYTDPVVIAAEVSWLNTQESVIECSGRADELAKPDLSEAAAHTAHVADEHVAAVVPEVDCKTENSNGTEQFLYSLYTDAAVSLSSSR
ncbi:hypothetical protein BJ741DRAFT_414942 [Chytriomyces cf. hyalinus JEL632]|nr:hypothetical protein BJ741DRAFT_414942 [Chytriomyces cf. hyalinus JEL632]